MRPLALLLLLILSGCATTSMDRAIQEPAAPRQPMRALGLGEVIAYPLGVALYPFVQILKWCDRNRDSDGPLGETIAVPPGPPKGPEGK